MTLKKRVSFLAVFAMILSFLYFNTDLFSISNSTETILEKNQEIEKKNDFTEKEFFESKSGFEAKVVRILDGDTLEVLVDQEPIRIRLEHIDCPEIRKGQPFGKAAKKLLSELCFNKEIFVEWNQEIDRYNRYIAVLRTKDGLNINKEMVRRGLAWHYKKYSKDETYDLLEKEARLNQEGLWKDPNPVPPWNWRSKKNSQKMKNVIATK